MNSELTKSESAFLELVRAHLWRQQLDLSYFQGLTFDDWMQINILAFTHGLGSIVGSMLTQLPSELRPSRSTLLWFYAKHEQLLKANERKRKLLANLCGHLRTKGLNPILMKGFALSQYYPHPDLREFCDFDIWLPEDGAEQMLESEGFVMMNKHKKHSVFKYAGYSFENHYSFLTPNGILNTNEIERILHETWQREGTSKLVLTENPEDYVLQFGPTHSLIFNLSHVAAHFCQIPTLRQICDFAILASTLRDKVDGDTYMSALHASKSLRRTEAILTYIITKYLGKDLLPSLTPDFDVQSTADRLLLQMLRNEVPSKSGLKGLKFWKVSWHRYMSYFWLTKIIRDDNIIKRVYRILKEDLETVEH